MDMLGLYELYYQIEVDLELKNLKISYVHQINIKNICDWRLKKNKCLKSKDFIQHQ